MRLASRSLAELGWSFRGRLDQSLSIVEKDHFKNNTNVVATHPQGAEDVLHQPEDLLALAFLESRGQVGSVEEPRTANLAREIADLGWSGGVGGWQKPSSATGVYQTLRRTESHVGLSLWQEGQKLVTVTTGGRSPEVVARELRALNDWLPDLKAEFGLERAGEILQTVASGHSPRAPKERFADLRSLYQAHPNHGLGERLLTKLEDPELRKPLMDWVLPFAKKEGWDPEKRFDDEYATLGAVDFLKAARPEERAAAWKEVQGCWKLLPSDCAYPSSTFRSLLKIHGGGAPGRAARLGEDLAQLDQALPLELPPGKSFWLRVRLLGLMYRRGGNFDKELARVQDLTERLKQCPEGIGEEGRALLDRLDRLPGVGDARDAVFQAYHHLHPEDYSNFIAWHFTGEEVQKLQRLNAAIPQHGFRLPVARHAIKLSDKVFANAFVPLYKGTQDAERVVKWIENLPAGFEFLPETPKVLNELARAGSPDPFNGAKILKQHGGTEAHLRELCEVTRVCAARDEVEESVPVFELLRELELGDTDRKEFLRRLEEHGLAGVTVSDLKGDGLRPEGPDFSWESDGIIFGDHWLPGDS